MKPPSSLSKFDIHPVVATWELWTVAQMLISTRGVDAECHAQAKLSQANDEGNEAGTLVWTGVITQLTRIRQGK